MAACPRCQKPVETQAIACPYCKNPLKAFGHAGIPLHQTQEGYLCDTCTYHHDETCNFPKYPYAKECTLYTDVSTPVVEPELSSPPMTATLRLWAKRNSTLLIFVGLALISVAIAIR
ncbi:MAG: hypothetical protein WBA57_17190 [Elainellaceae cyanobacterium]